MPRPHTRAPGDAEPNDTQTSRGRRAKGGVGHSLGYRSLRRFSLSTVSVCLSLALSSRAHALLSRAAGRPLLGRGDRWHSTDRCHSALLSSKAIFQGGRGALPTLPSTYSTCQPTVPWPCNAAAVPRPQIWGRCNCHDLYPVYGSCMQRCVRVVCCSTSIPSFILPPRCLFYWPRQLPTTPENAGARRESRRACSSHQPVGCALSVIAPARRGQVTTVICMQSATSRLSHRERPSGQPPFGIVVPGG